MLCLLRVIPGVCVCVCALDIYIYIYNIYICILYKFDSLGLGYFQSPCDRFKWFS